MPIYSYPGGTWADALDPIVRKWFDLGMKRRPSLLPILFNMQTSVRAYEAISGIGAIGTEAWDDFNNSGQVPEVDFNQGYKKTYTHRRYPVDLSIDKTTIDDNQFPTLFNQIARLGDSAALKREVDGMGVFNNGFTGAAYYGSDGVSLFSDSHPNSPNNAGVQDNNFTLALTKTNVRTVREAMMAFADDHGNPMAVTPDTVLVPPALEDDAIEIFGSQLNPDNANNTINPMFGRVRILTSHYLTDSTAWYLIDSSLMRMSLDWFDRDPLTIRRRDGDDETLVAYWRAYMRYSYGFSDWRWIAGSKP